MNSTVWLVIGFLGQLLFTSRFLVQWIASERLRRSVVPTAFWWFSIGGGVLLLAYALYRRDPVFSLGQGMGLVVYFRNLMLIRHEAHDASTKAAKPAVENEAATI